MSTEPSPSPLSDALAVARYHIVLVAMAAALTFGWIMTGRYPWAVVPLVGLDWFLINLMNRITDIDEDTKNQIRGTAGVARHKRALTVISSALLGGSILAVHFVLPALTPFRVAVHVIGLGYNYDIVPTPRGLSRFKEIYFLKNFGSAVIFVLTCFAYPLAASGGPVPWGLAVVLIFFFIPFELTYEILYDVRDLDGDRSAGIPTYPVVHGLDTSRRIIDGLLLVSAGALVAGLFSRILGVREILMIAAPAVQIAFYRPRYRTFTSRDAVVLTHLGTAQLTLFLVGTALWDNAGLPRNIYL